MQVGSGNKRYKIYNAFCLFKAGEVEVDDGFVEKNWTEEKCSSITLWILFKKSIFKHSFKVHQRYTTQNSQQKLWPGVEKINKAKTPANSSKQPSTLISSYQAIGKKTRGPESPESSYQPERLPLKRSTQFPNWFFDKLMLHLFSTRNFPFVWSNQKHTWFSLHRNARCFRLRFRHQVRFLWKPASRTLRNEQSLN